MLSEDAANAATDGRTLLKNDERTGEKLTPLEEVMQQPLMMGLFLPLQSGAWTPSTLPRGTSCSFDYVAKCAVKAEEFGFDLVFGLAEWLGKGGYGGAMNFREESTDPLIVTAGIAALTKRILLVSTVHILYGWHPLQLAKFGATIDNISGGRWGINIVTGFRKGEINRFALQPIDHDLRYEMADEFTTFMKRLWTEGEVSIDGRFWKMKNGFVAPKPVNGSCILVTAASSGAGLAFAGKHTKLLFITSPAGAEFEKARVALGPHNARIKQAARDEGREVRTIINPHVICRETEKEAWAQYQAILDHQDPVAADNFYATFQGGDTTSWREASRNQWVIGGNVHLVGTPEQIVEQFKGLKAAGCDGILVNFYDYLPDLDFFGNRVIPLMRQSGLRIDIERSSEAIVA